MRHASRLVLVGFTCFCGAQRATAEPLAEKYLHAGKLADGEKAILAELVQNPKDDQARFGLGALQFIRSVEHLGQSLYRYGLRSNRGREFNIPFVRLPVPENPKPETINYGSARKILQDLVDDLTKAEATLAAIQDEKVKLPLRVGLIRLDLAGDGGAGEPFSTILARYMGGAAILPKDNKELLVVFTRGDVAWLRGYCHLLMFLADVGLAYDGQELFECTAHIFFAKVQTPHKFLNVGDEDGLLGFKGLNVFDLISFIHLIRMPVKEPDRMKSALNHLEKMLALSK
jgi:hypothetical protein